MDSKYNTPKTVQSKKIFIKVFTTFIEELKKIESTYLSINGSMWLLFDNSDTRISLSDSFYNIKRKNLYPQYKSHRKKENIEIYNTVDLIKYYFMINEKKYKCIQVANLEADDLVKPLLSKFKTNDFNLFITNDSDWSRYLTERTHILPNIHESPMNVDEYSQKVGFPISELNVITHKSLFGDSTDEVPQVISKTKLHVAQFNEYLMNGSFSSTNDIMLDARAKKFDIFNHDELQENIHQFNINLQLTSSIPVQVEHLDAVTVVGRNAVKLREALEKSTGLSQIRKKFSFGFNRPRV
jgi:hypothetical protein